MPSSFWGLINEVIDAYMRAKPRTVLDLGVGFGKWGHLFREYGDIYQGRIDKDDWRIRIDGVEAYVDYIRDHQKYIYTNLYIGNVLDFVRDMPWYDFIYAGDVIEHISKHEAIPLLEHLSSHCATLLVSLPLGPRWSQGAVGGNPYETHRSMWRESEMRRLGFKTIGLARAELFRPIALFKRASP